MKTNVMLAGSGHGEGGRKGREFKNGAGGFEQGTSKDGDSLPWSKI